ncbi:signal peptidase I [Nocardioides aurantiacus]|uniref:Signal peptidase I n=1 Tax=Nocardioides aurantiacus TaxID=86796 RepID=A0A3N2CRS0_9ACTN|nr:signal peptidase I [Nocardioides aurantiacus]
MLVGSPTLAEPMKVASDSMSPTYSAGDEVLVVKVGVRSHRPRKGDVVVLRAPGSGELMVKRVVALGGESVGIRDGVLVVRNRPVVESFVDHSRVDGTHFGPVHVPRHTVWVLGDARAGSRDSRQFGPVPQEAIVGRVLLRLW